MTDFMNDNFLLKNKKAIELFHNYAQKMPIFDYHCHLSPKEIAENKKFNNLTELWLSGDHYKWRAMRAHGIEERLITGDAPDAEKFAAWAETVPYTIGNALYHWTHLELKRYFGVDELLSEQNWESIYDHCNALLLQDDFSVQGLIKRSNVKVICTTDDPTDELFYHDQIKTQPDFDVKVLPTFRPDKGLEINKDTFAMFVEKLGDVTGQSIITFTDFLNGLEKRIDFFHDKGCRLSDHGLAEIPFERSNEAELNTIFQDGRCGSTVNKLQEDQFKTAVLLFLGACYKKRGWAMQIHFGAIRNTNEKLFKQIGPDAGFDSISDQGKVAASLNAMLNALDLEDSLPRTILYNLNPNHNDLIGSTVQNFQTEPGIRGKIQFGSGWWFNDTKPGILRQLTSLADQALLPHFIGMLTDSRSFLSYTRHEYFRRVLCNLVGTWVEEGEVPNDDRLLQNLIENISYNNARNYFTIQEV